MLGLWMDATDKIGGIMPLTKSGKKVLKSMKKTYGSEKKGKEVFYASINKKKKGSKKWHGKGGGKKWSGSREL